MYLQAIYRDSSWEDRITGGTCKKLCPLGVFEWCWFHSGLREKFSDAACILARGCSSHPPYVWMLPTTRGSEAHIWNHLEQHLEAVMSCNETQLFNYSGSISFATVKLSVAIQPPRHRSQHTIPVCYSSYVTLVAVQEASPLSSALPQWCPAQGNNCGKLSVPARGMKWKGKSRKYSELRTIAL